jgi:hypothetical protein
MVSEARRQSNWLEAQEATRDAAKDVESAQAVLDAAHQRLEAAKQNEEQQERGLFVESPPEN